MGSPRRLLGSIYVIAVAVMVAGCSGTPPGSVDNALNEIDRLVFVDPDSAAVVLKTIDRRDIHGRKNVSRYLLLSTVTNYRHGIIPESADDILTARAYYTDSSVSDSLLAVVHFYTGCVLEDMGHTENALEAYLESNARLDEADGNHFWKGMVSHSLGRLYYDYLDYRTSLKYAKQAVGSFKESRDTINVIHAYHTLMRCTLFSDGTGPAMSIFEQANEWCGMINNIGGLLDNALVMSGILMEYPDGLYGADSLLQSTYKVYNNGTVPLDHFPMQSRIEAEKGNYTEAVALLSEYMNKVELTLTERLSFSYLFAEYNNSLKQYRQAYDHLHGYVSLVDSVYNIELVSSLQEAEKKHAKRELENEYEMYRTLTVIVIIAGSILFVMIVSIILMERRRKIRKLQQKFIALREQVGELDKLKEDMAKILDKKNEKETRLGNVLLNKMNRIQKIADYLFLYENNPAEFQKKVHTAIINAERDEYFGDLHEVVNQKYAGIVDYLKQRYPKLSEIELNLCCLICFGFTNNQIGILFGHTNSASVFTNRHKLRKKLNLWPNYESLETFLLKMADDLRTGVISVQPYQQ